MPNRRCEIAFFVMFRGSAMGLCSEFMLPRRFPMEILHDDCSRNCTSTKWASHIWLTDEAFSQLNDRAKSHDRIRSHSYHSAPSPQAFSFQLVVGPAVSQAVSLRTGCYPVQAALPPFCLARIVAPRKETEI